MLYLCLVVKLMIPGNWATCVGEVSKTQEELVTRSGAGLWGALQGLARSLSFITHPTQPGCAVSAEEAWEIGKLQLGNTLQ